MRSEFSETHVLSRELIVLAAGCRLDFSIVCATHVLDFEPVSQQSDNI